MTTIYRISAITPEEGNHCYEVLDEQEARKIHSDLLQRQLKGDGTHSVKVRTV